MTINPGLLRRVDLLAVANPRATRRAVWTFGFFSIWQSIGIVSAAILGYWAAAALALFGLMVSGAAWWVSRRAIQRVPETNRWIAELTRQDE